jgi:hypothetical protein
MKKLIICTAVLGLAFSSAAQAKGASKALSSGVLQVQSPGTVRPALLLVA